MRVISPLGIGLLFMGGAALAGGPTLMDLAPLPGDSSSVANAVNTNGGAAGYSSGLTLHATFWAAGKGPVDLGNLPNGSSAQANGVNAAGAVVGQAVLSNFTKHAFIWTSGFGIAELPTLTNVISVTRANAINDNGNAVGVSDDLSFTGHGVLWSGATALPVPLDLGVLGAFESSEASAISPTTDLVCGYGTFTTAVSQVLHALLWTKSVGAGGVVSYALQDLGLPAGSSYDTSVATGVNDAGTVCGTLSNLNSPTPPPQHAFLWENGTFTDLGSKLPASFPSTTASAATGINDNGDVVGYTLLVKVGEVAHAILWPANGTAVDLGTFTNLDNSTVSLSSAANAINANGRIVGFADGTNGGLFSHGFFADVAAPPPPPPPPPVANAGAAQVLACKGALTPVTLDGSKSTGAPGATLTYTWSSGGVTLANTAVATVNFAPGAYTVQLLVSDGTQSSTADVSITITDDTPPLMTATVVPAPNAAGWNKTAEVDLSGTDDCSGVSAIHFTLDNTKEEIVSGASAKVAVLGDGIHQIVYYGVDGAGNISTPLTLEVRVDTTAPVLTASVSPSVLERPNHKLVPVNVVGQLLENLTPGGEPVTATITSNEPDSGQGDVNGLPGPVVLATTTDPSGNFAFAFTLRASRLSSGTGRIYTISLTSSDAAGNSASLTLTVTVPLNDDGPGRGRHHAANHVRRAREDHDRDDRDRDDRDRDG